MAHRIAPIDLGPSWHGIADPRPSFVPCSVGAVYEMLAAIVNGDDEPAAEPIDYPDDVARIRAALGADAEQYTDRQIADAWEARSEDWCAGWLSLPAADAIAAEVTPWLGKRAR